jgi:tRNA A-37 threonylcarbamoyl transferase component Bud32
MWNWLGLIFRKSAGERDGAKAHMTFGQTLLGRTMSRTGVLLKKQLWIWPIVAVVLLAIVGYVINGAIHQTMENELRSELLTLLNIERSMLEKWLKVQESNATSVANSTAVRETIGKLIAADDDGRKPSATDREQEIGALTAQLAKDLEPTMAAHHYIGFVVADKRQRSIAATARDLIGQIVPQHESFFARALDGAPTVSAPFPSVSIQKDSLGRARSGTPTMFVCAPVRDENLQVIAVLALRIRPEQEFTEILQLGRIGETGETYAVNKDGLMVSNSRFDNGLILLGLIPDTEGSASIVNIQIRDPGGNMVDGFRPTVRRHELPLTEAAAAATTGTTGLNMTGYRDYRGSPSVGAWTWLPDYQMGIISEIDIAEAYRPLTILKWSFFSMFALLALSAVAIFVFTIVVSRLQRQARRATIEAKQLGQYRLEDKIGAGAMGVVYKGRHAMLRRPTAIKMLDVERVNEASIARFEREVQITCNLNNPHTVAIYDYGRTPENVFYYAMEFLDGIDLQSLVEQDGPQPEGRVAAVLRQICASLYEAHSLGLVHRDIKPANIMLNRRGGEPDVVKVLDFGLVKALDDKQAAGDMSGTPLYMSPEAIQTPDLVDPRSDIYAVGAVGYFLLTGQTAFNARSLSELCQQHVTAIPEPPSQRLGRAVSAELEYALLACLEKNRAKRPQTARDLATMLERVTAQWSLDDAEAWWGRHERGQHGASKSNGAGAQAHGAATIHNAGGKPAAVPAQKPPQTHLDRTTIFENSDDET